MFQVSKAVKQEGATDGAERMTTAKFNSKREVYLGVDTMASKSVVTEGTLDRLRIEMPMATRSD